MAKKKKDPGPFITVGWPEPSKELREEHPKWINNSCCLCGKAIYTPKKGQGGPMRACENCIECLKEPLR